MKYQDFLPPERWQRKLGNQDIKNFLTLKKIKPLNKPYFLAMFTLYWIGFCSVSKVAPVQCEKELMFCCGAEIVPKRSQCEQKPYPLCNLQRSLLIWKDNLPKTRFRCNFCSDKSVQTWFSPFQKPIRYGTFHFQQRSGAVLFRSRNCFESSVPSVNRSPIRYTFCDAPFHYPVQCENSLYKRDNSPVLTLSRIPKSKMMSHNCLWACIAIIAYVF